MQRHALLLLLGLALAATAAGELGAPLGRWGGLPCVRQSASSAGTAGGAAGSGASAYLGAARRNRRRRAVSPTGRGPGASAAARAAPRARPPAAACAAASRRRSCGIRPRTDRLPASWRCSLLLRCRPDRSPADADPAPPRRRHPRAIDTPARPQSRTRRATSSCATRAWRPSTRRSTGAATWSAAASRL